jgi:hypothetical protein
MSTDLEADLRREFDAVGAPSGLTFSPESVLRQGNRTIRRNRILAVGSTAMAVALVAVGATVMTRPHSSAAPLPASHTATSGIFRGQLGFDFGTFEAHFQLKAGVATNVHYFAITPDGLRHEVVGSSTGKPGQSPDATWVSGLVAGHPVTIGLVPNTARDVRITFTDGGSYGLGSHQVWGTGYTVFAVPYPATASATDIASIRWYGPTGIVDGIDGDHRLIGRVVPISDTESAEVVLQAGAGGPTTVFGRLIDQNAAPDLGGSNASEIPAYDLAAVTTDPSGVAVMTGRLTITRKTGDTIWTTSAGAPIAAGILPSGASGIGVELTDGGARTGLAKTERLPDGRVIFTMSAGFAHPADPGKDSIKAVTWTNADGTRGRKDVTQQQR